MELINKIKKWFKDETKSFQTPQEELVKPNKPEIKDVDTSLDFGKEFECDFCKDTIRTFQKRKTFNGKKYHKECFRTIYRLCRKEAGI